MQVGAESILKRAEKTRAAVFGLRLNAKARKLAGDGGVVGLRQGDALQVGSFDLQTVWPERFSDEGGNADSLCLVADADIDGDGASEWRALFTGDAERDQLRALIDRVLGPLGRRIDEASPMVNARLPEGHRVHVIIPPLALDGPVMTVRKFAKRVMTLDDMVATGSFDEAMRTFLVWAVRARKSIAVSGGTGSGKTTLLNALSCELPPSERIITIEDSAELRFLEHPHVVRLEARPRNAEGTGEVTIRDLVINALRMRPDRIVVGECRGAEALDMLQAMNTGHDGSLTTLHANSPADVVSRLATMVRYAVDLPVDVIESNVASAFEVVVQTARALDGSRFVSDVAELVYDGGKRCCRVRPLFMRGLAERVGRWVALPAWIDEVADIGVAEREEVERWKRTSCLAA